MLKKRVPYEDFFGNKREEDLYFNLTKMELKGLQASENGGLDKIIKKMIDEQDLRSIYNLFVKIIDLAYGEPSADGRYFVKEDENGNKLVNKFKQSMAYEKFMDEITKDEKSIADFINGVIPKELSDELNKQQNNTIKFHN